MTRTSYRLPWRVGTSPTLFVSLSDGCGFDCCGNRCEPKPFESIQAQLAAVERWSRADSLSLVGGEPSRHPKLTDIVKLAARDRRKVILCTNGYDLGIERLTELRDAGLWGVNLRINAAQARPGWLDRPEAQIEGLRSHYAEMIARVGGLLCSFELELPEGRFRQLADALAWAERNIDRVQRIVVRLDNVETQDTPGVRPGDMAENWAASGWLASSNPSVPAGSVVWRVGRRGSEVLAASPRLLQLLCETYETLHKRHFAFINPQSFRSQMACWLGALTDLSLRPLAMEILANLRSPSKLSSPRLASQFLFTLEPGQQPQQQAPCPGAGWDSLAAPVSSVSLHSADV